MLQRDLPRNSKAKHEAETNDLLPLRGESSHESFFVSAPMCLGIPGKLVSIFREHDLLMGKIDFGGVVKQICLETLPKVAVGDYLLIHVGFALAKIDEAEARQIFSFLDGMNELGEIRASGDSAIDSVG
jgi:hydrogenase expression/formation protein HypC